jgi:hypothetical protein
LSAASEDVSALVVDGVGDEFIETDAPPQRLHIRFWCGTVLAKGVKTDKRRK